MYSSVPPPNQDSPVAKRDGENDEKNPPRGISKEMWEVFILIMIYGKVKALTSSLSYY